MICCIFVRAFHRFLEKSITWCISEKSLMVYFREINVMHLVDFSSTFLLVSNKSESLAGFQNWMTVVRNWQFYWMTVVRNWLFYCHQVNVTHLAKGVGYLYLIYSTVGRESSVISYFQCSFLKIKWKIILTKFSTSELYALVDTPKLFGIWDFRAGSGVINGRFMLDNLITASKNNEWVEEARQVPLPQDLFW